MNGSVVEGPDAIGTFSTDDIELTSGTTDNAAERVWEFLQYTLLLTSA